MSMITPYDLNTVQDVDFNRMRLIKTLNGLLAVCLDSRHMFGAAAEDTHEPQLSDLYIWHANKRQDFARDLASIITAMGAEPNERETVTGSVMRSWMDLQAGFVVQREHAILSACEAAEDRVKRAYERALASAMDVDIERRIREQHEVVHAAHDQIRYLRDLHQAS